MRLSRKESRFRIKIIQENHYNKVEQKILDKAVSEMTIRYKDVYKAQRIGRCYVFMAVIAEHRLSKAFETIGIMAKQAAEGISGMDALYRKNMCSEIQQNLF